MRKRGKETRKRELGELGIAEKLRLAKIQNIDNLIQLPHTHLIFPWRDGKNKALIFTDQRDRARTAAAKQKARGIVYRTPKIQKTHTHAPI